MGAEEVALRKALANVFGSGPSGFMSFIDALGFQWNRSAVRTSIPVHSVERACFHFHKTLPGFVWDASMLEGNPLTFVEVKTLLDGITVGGKKIADQEQVLNLIKGSKHLLAIVKSEKFDLSKSIFTELNGIVARNESLEWGVFRGEEKEKAELDRIFSSGVVALQECEPFERAIAFFLFGALQRFFSRGNIRTSQFMMNGVLMSHGIDPISVPAAKVQEIKEKMARFFLSKDATEMMIFLSNCHPDAKLIHQI